MRALLNPLLLVVCILLLAFGYVSAASGAEDHGMPETWVLTLCLLGIVINGTLGVARLLAGYPSVQSIGWAVGFLVFGSIVWTLVSGEQVTSLSSQERVALHERMEGWKTGQLAPWALDENGDCVPILAAGLGREDVLAEMLEDAAAVAAHADVLVRAAHRAAERNREGTLRQLLAAGVSADARLEDMTLLHTAALNQSRRVAACLLAAGASPHATTRDGSTPLHQAVLAEDVPMIRLLMQHGANAAQTDAEGRDAASYARSEAVSEALIPAPAGSAAE